MNITYEELVAEFQKQFPKEFTICAQALQIAKLQEQVTETSDAEED